LKSFQEFGNHAGLVFLFPLKAEFATQVTKIHEQVREREQELIGGWYTEERMQTDLSYSKLLA